MPDLFENPNQGEGGVEFESSEEAREALDEQRVEEQVEDPSVLANPTELQQGGVSGGDPANTQGGDAAGGPVDGGSLPGNAGDAAQPASGNSGDARAGDTAGS